MNNSQKEEAKKDKKLIGDYDYAVIIIMTRINEKK